MAAQGLRLFWAIGIDRKTREAIDAWCRANRARFSGWRFLPSEGWHLTLRFLGQTDPALVDALLDGARRTLADLGAWTLTIGGWSVMPSRHRPRVLALDFARGTGPAAEAAARLEALAVRLGFPAERRPFRAHLTVARARRGARPVVPGDAGPGPDASFRAGEITLFRSHLEPAGARYEAVGSVVLGAA